MITILVSGIMDFHGHRILNKKWMISILLQMKVKNMPMPVKE